MTHASRHSPQAASLMNHIYIANLMPGLRRSHSSYQDDQNYYEPTSEFVCAPSHMRRIIVAVQGESVQTGVALPFPSCCQANTARSEGAIFQTTAFSKRFHTASVDYVRPLTVRQRSAKCRLSAFMLRSSRVRASRAEDLRPRALCVRLWQMLRHIVVPSLEFGVCSTRTRVAPAVQSHCERQALRKRFQMAARRRGIPSRTHRRKTTLPSRRKEWGRQ